jgi:hypothetical protein
LLDGGRPCGEGEGLLGGNGGNEGVSGEGGEIVEKGSEAVDREAVVGSAGGLLGDGGGSCGSMASNSAGRRAASKRVLPASRRRYCEEVLDLASATKNQRDFKVLFFDRNCWLGNAARSWLVKEHPAGMIADLKANS